VRVEALFEPLGPPVQDLEACRAQPRAGDLAEQAVLGGLRTDRLGWAFASGYAAAGRRMFGGAELWALCATESGGAHPRAIRTTLVEGRLSGTKGFVSMGRWAERLAVVARTGEQDGRPKLVVAVVDPASSGVTLREGAELPFVPEIPHGVLVLDGVEPVRVLPGDGYTGVLRPFRTVEDAHVMLAAAGLLLRWARQAGDRARVEELLVQILALAAICEADPGSSATHLALAGALSRSRSLFESARAPSPEEASMLERDRPLLGIAGKAREARRSRAWERLG
jgi:acyl-CoA dehydrogenase